VKFIRVKNIKASAKSTQFLLKVARKPASFIFVRVSFSDSQLVKKCPLNAKKRLLPEFTRGIVSLIESETSSQIVVRGVRSWPRGFNRARQ
jgi:hypothetical protein